MQWNRTLAIKPLMTTPKENVHPEIATHLYCHDSASELIYLFLMMDVLANLPRFSKFLISVFQ